MQKKIKPADIYWRKKAKGFVEYLNEECNKDRDVVATLGDYGITFLDDIQQLKEALKNLGEHQTVHSLEKEGM